MLLSVMKKVIWFLMFLMLVGGVMAMSEPVSVKTQPGDWVKVYVWPVESGILLNMGDGVADENGTFEITFFSLNVPDVKFTIFVIRNKEKVRDVDFLGHNISEPLNIDCRNVGCEKVSETVEDLIEEVVENESVENETVVVDEEVVVEESRGFIATGKAIFSRDDGSLNLGYSIGGGVILLFMFVFVFMVLHRGKRKGGLDGDDKELKYMEKKVAETAEKIKGVKDGRDRRDKIYKAKLKLAEEERELQELEAGGNSRKIEEQEDVVKKVEDKVEKAEDKVEEN